MPDTPFMIGAYGMIVDVSYNGFASPGQATVGLVPNIATGEATNAYSVRDSSLPPVSQPTILSSGAPSPGPWIVTKLLPGAVLQLTGGGEYDLVSGASALQGIGTSNPQTSPLGSGARGSIQVDLVTGTAGTVQGVAFIVGNVNSTTMYAGISLDTQNRPNFFITDNTGTTQVQGTPSGSAIPSGVVLQIRLFWDANGAVAFFINGVTQAFTAPSGPWSPFVPVAVLYGQAANGFGTQTAFLGRLNKTQVGTSSGGLIPPFQPEPVGATMQGSSNLTVTARPVRGVASSISGSSSLTSTAGVQRGAHATISGVATVTAAGTLTT
jgi:hypothetical protein